jgi:hypothetical protein
MARGLAQSGIEKWTVDTGRMTMTFYDKASTEILIEQISDCSKSRIIRGYTDRAHRDANQAARRIPTLS